ncbi:hypothetical protein ACI65C_006025 [Semiaphis heraclei]
MAKTRKYPSRIKKRKGNPSLLESRKSKNISENLEIRKNEIPTDNNIDFVTELSSTSNVESSYLENCSYELRCNAAVTSYNLGANRLSVFNKHVTDKSPGKFTKSYIKTNLGTINKKNRLDDSLVKIKCPASAKELSTEDAITVGKIKGCLVNNGQLQLNRNNNYFYQVQGQLHISRKMFCYFCVWTPKGLMYEKIQRDDEFWENNMKLKLEHFNLKHLLPSLIKEKY